MKEIVLKSMIIFSAIIFLNYIAMIALGCISCCFEASNDFYDCTYCNIGKGMASLSAIGFLVIIVKDVKKQIKK